MEKMRTEEELVNEWRRLRGGGRDVEGDVLRVVAAAREGMIDASLSIHLPKTEDWERTDYWGIKGYVAHFTDYDEATARGKYGASSVYVARPVPEWKPGPTDPVAWWGEAHDDDYAPAAALYGHLNATPQHCAKIESLADIGMPVGWFKDNRPHR